MYEFIDEKSNQKQTFFPTEKFKKYRLLGNAVQNRKKFEEHCYKPPLFIALWCTFLGYDNMSFE